MKIIKRILILILILTSSLLIESCDKRDNESNLITIDNPKNIVLIIGDGMGENHAIASSIYYSYNYQFLSFNQVKVDTCSLSSSMSPTKTTDSAAGATAISTGTLTKNSYVGVDSNNKELDTILDYAKEKDMKTGIVTTDKLYGATPASFSAHSISRDDTDTILKSQIISNVDLLVGAKSDTCLDFYNSVNNCYTYCESIEEINNLDKNKRVYSLLPLEGDTSNGIELKDIVKSSMDHLTNDNGFFLMVEQAHIDKKSHNNDFNGLVQMVKSLNDTVNYIIDNYEDTLVIVTADHETGGLNISTSSLLLNKTTCINGTTISYQFNSTGHTNTNIIMYYYGFDYNFKTLDFYKSDKIIKNNEQYYILIDLIDEIRKNTEEAF